MSRCEDEQMWRWADVKMSRCEDEQMWRWAGVKMSRCEDEQVWRWADVKMSRCEDEQMWRWADVKSRCEEQMWRWADVKMSRCEDEQMWRWADVKMSRCEDEQVWRWAGVKMRRCEDEQMWWADVMSRCEDEQMWRWEGVKMRRCEDEKAWRWEGVKMRRCEDEKMRYRPPLLEEPCAQTLSGKAASSSSASSSSSSSSISVSVFPPCWRQSRCAARLRLPTGRNSRCAVVGIGSDQLRWYQLMASTICWGNLLRSTLAGWWILRISLLHQHLFWARKLRTTRARSCLASCFIGPLRGMCGFLQTWLMILWWIFNQGEHDFHYFELFFLKLLYAMGCPHPWTTSLPAPLFAMNSRWIARKQPKLCPVSCTWPHCGAQDQWLVGATIPKMVLFQD